MRYPPSLYSLKQQKAREYWTEDDQVRGDELDDYIDVEEQYDL